MFTNLLLGGALLRAGPALAVYVKGKVEAESRKRAKELAPAAIREAAAKVGPNEEPQII